MYLRAMRLVSANNAGKGSDMCCTEWPFCALQCEEAALEEKFSTKPIEVDRAGYGCVHAHTHTHTLPTCPLRTCSV